jgi:hypothetical protein
MRQQLRQIGKAAVDRKPQLEVALKLFESARAELVARIGLRDQILMLFVAASGAIFTVALSKQDHYELALVVPILTLGAALLVAQHNGMIGAIRAYCAMEFQQTLEREKIVATQWDNSDALRQFRKSGVSQRSWGHIIVLVVPAAIGLGVNYRHFQKLVFPFGPLWWLGVCSATIAIVVLGKSHALRSARFDKYSKWAKRFVRGKP